MASWLKNSRSDDTVEVETAPVLEAVGKDTPMGENTYTASEAAKLTGRSYPTVTQARDKLAAAGAVVEGTGKEWRIPISALIKVGWLNEDGSPVEARRGRKAGSSNSAPVSTGSIKDLKAAAEHAEARAEDLKEQARVAAAEARDARRAFDNAVAAAEANLRAAQQQYEEALALQEG
tara:strand:- start:923 stop:1453 length:531 start_codon:yes stop_codon:yes gene_type:complete